MNGDLYYEYLLSSSAVRLISFGCSTEITYSFVLRINKFNVFFLKKNTCFIQVCAALRKMSSVLRLGVYRERIEKYGRTASSNLANNEELLTVTLERQTGKHLGIRISGSCPEPGIFIVEILDDSITALDGRIKPYDRLLSINGTDVRHCKISQASDLIKVSR